MSRIDTAFQRLRAEGRKALVPFITAGDPDLGVTVDLMHALVEAGADIIELGVPFSDPMADGPVIQRASERALARGVGLHDVLACVERFRGRDAVTPVVLMGYANPVENMGYEPFATSAQRAGVDGLLTVDLPPEESEPLVLCLREHGIAPVFLISPTSTAARMRDVARLGGGFIYYVSLKGVTGAAHLDLTEVARRLPDIKALTALPVGVGFGIRDAETARAVAGVADAVVVGSRIVQEIESSSPAEVVGRVRALVSDLRSAMDAR